MAVSFVTVTIAYSSRWTFPVFYVAIIDEFGWSYAATAAAMSINLAIYTLFCPVAGALSDKFGVRKVIPLGAILLGITLVACRQINSVWQLYVLFGLTATGTAIIGIVPNLAVLSNWFTTRRGLVMGIGTSGLGLGITFSPYTQYLVATIGWRNAYLVFAALAVGVVVPLAAIFLRDRPEPRSVPDAIVEVAEKVGKSNPTVILGAYKEWGAKDWTLARSAQTYHFWLLVLVNILFGMTDYVLITHQVAYLVKDIGFSRMFGASAFGCFGVSFVIGSLGGLISDRIGRESAFTLSSVGCLVGIVCLLRTTDTLTPWLPYLSAVLTGAYNGSGAAILPSAGADLFAGRHFGVINGIMTLSLVGGGAVGAWAAGMVRDATGAFAIAFLSLLLAVCLATVSLWLIAPRKIR